jgi:hypothetical protein
MSSVVPGKIIENRKPEPEKTAGLPEILQKVIDLLYLEFPKPSGVPSAF